MAKSLYRGYNSTDTLIADAAVVGYDGLKCYGAVDVTEDSIFRGFTDLASSTQSGVAALPTGVATATVVVPNLTTAATVLLTAAGPADATATIFRVTPAAGQFVITANAAPTAGTNVAWFVASK
jgi:hypothetical protein